MGILRIKRNLQLNCKYNDIIEYCKHLILDKNSNIYKKGKNYYLEINNTIITINSHKFTIITAHIK